MKETQPQRIKGESENGPAEGLFWAAQITAFVTPVPPRFMSRLTVQRAASYFWVVVYSGGGSESRITSLMLIFSRSGLGYFSDESQSQRTLIHSQEIFNCVLLECLDDCLTSSKKMC